MTWPKNETPNPYVLKLTSEFGVTYTPQETGLSVEVAIRQGFVCNSCRQPVKVVFSRFPDGWEWGEETSKKGNLHHKDRNHKNNSPENLEFLCMNCHALIHCHQNKPQLSFTRVFKASKES